jgi:hypothetical protein
MECIPKTHPGEGAVVPEVTLVREAVAHKTQFTLLDILLDGIEEFLLRDLHRISVHEFCPWPELFSGQYDHTSCLAFVQRGISTIMFRTVCCSLA